MVLPYQTRQDQHGAERSLLLAPLGEPLHPAKCHPHSRRKLLNFAPKLRLPAAATTRPSCLHICGSGGGINHGRSSRSSSQTRVVDRYPQVGRSSARADGHARHDFRPLIGYLRLPDCLPTNRSVASRLGPAHRRGPRP